MTVKTFTFSENEDVHEICTRDCTGGWCGGYPLGYPKPCTEPECLGLVHADFGDESYEGYWLYTCCDVCGEPE